MYAPFPRPTAPSVGEVLTRHFLQNCANRELYARLGQDVALTGIPSRRPNIDVDQDEASDGIPFQRPTHGSARMKPYTAHPPDT